MEPLPGVENSLAEATEQASKYQWSKAAETFREVAGQLNKTSNPTKTAETLELAAKSYFKAAFQSTTRKDFQHLMNLSENTYEQARILYEVVGAEALAKRGGARGLFANYWMLDEPDEKRIALAKCIPLAQESAHIFDIHGDKEHLADTLLDLISYREMALHLSKERRELVDLFDSAVETAWRIIDEEGLASDETRLEAVGILVQLYLDADYVLEQPRYEELERRLAKLKDRPHEYSEKIRTNHANALASEASMNLALDLEQDIPKTLMLFEKALSNAKATGDRCMIGRLYNIAASVARWSAVGEEYIEKRREQLERAIRLAENGIENLQPCPGYFLKRAYGIKIDSSNYLALTVESDVDKKRRILREAIDSTQKAIKYESQSFLTGIGHQLGRSMYLLATMDVGPEEKKRLLAEALPIREQIAKTFELLSPHSWSRGLILNYLALVRVELAKIETNPVRKSQLLKDAGGDMELCVRLCGTLAGANDPASQIGRGKFRMLAQFNEWHGDVLQQLYDTTMEASVNREAVESYKQSITYLSKSGIVGPIAPVRWKIAQTYDALKEYTDSSESFRQAAQEYRLAGKKIAGLTDVFEDYARYMEAWAVIEEARLNHEREQYSGAAEAYTKVANSLREMKKWNHLSTLYSAASFLELGEAMSRQDRQQGAMESFNAAKTNFQRANHDIEEKIPGSGFPEKQELVDWLEISNGRLHYTLARLQLEEAKVLDARMEEEASSAKYQIASESFRKIISDTRHQPTRAELETLSLLCSAWAKMKKAEANASPELYAEAASSFKLVESKVASKKTRLAALANESMCKALESGCLFRRTRDRQLYERIKSDLETASDFYEEAGIKKAADWTRATQRFFDALVYLRDAEVETDAKKRIELFHLAENHLQLAATIYGEAGYTAKRQESLRHLHRAREEKQLLMMPVEVLAESPAVGDVMISPLSLAEDKAIGIAKFEDAHVVGTMKLSSNELNAGERFIVELQLVNIGKAPATLERIEGLAAKGLEILSETDYPVEEQGINLRGKRLDYLKSYELKIPIRTRRKGVVEMKPRIQFVNEKGQKALYQFEPAIVRVKEIGVLGWIRGPS